MEATPGPGMLMTITEMVKCQRIQSRAMSTIEGMWEMDHEENDWH